MGKNDYINYNRRYKSRKSKEKSGMVIGLLLVLIIAAAAGFSAFYLTRGRLGEGPGMSGYTGGVSTPVPSPSEVAVVTDTPEPTPEPSAVPVMGGEDYLIGFTDTRNAVDAKAIYAPYIYDKTYVEQIIRLAKTTELNAVVIDVRDDYGRISYQMDYAPAKEMGVTTKIISDLPALLKTFHDNGVYVIARVVCFRELILNGEEMGLTQKKHPEWYCTAKKVNADSSITHYQDRFYSSTETGGKKASWMNPYSDEACKYLVGVAAQAIKDGFDEVTFDYVRCTTQYVSTCDFGIPDSEYVPRTESNWGFPRTITERITAFSKYACNVIKPLGGFASITLESMIISSSEDEEAQGQNYQTLSQYYDYLCPMIIAYGYGKGYAGISIPNNEPDKLVDFLLKKSKDRLATMTGSSATGHVAEVRPWLQAVSAEWIDKNFVYTPKVIRSQFQPCYNNGAKGWILWNTNNTYSDDIFEKK